MWSCSDVGIVYSANFYSLEVGAIGARLIGENIREFYRAGGELYRHGSRDLLIDYAGMNLKENRYRDKCFFTHSAIANVQQ